MPNQPATPVHCFRIPDPMWAEMERIAKDRGESMTDFALRAFAREIRLYPTGES